MVSYTTYRLKSGELTGSGPRFEARTSLFVAFRFDDSTSRKFREEFELRMRSTEALHDILVTDGRVGVGENWPGAIRTRLQKARLAVAELTNLSREVLFECGFAAGLNRQILPVVEDRAWYERLPRWLTDLQIGSFADERGWNAIIDAVAVNVAPSRSGRRKRLPEPQPGRAVWLDGTSWLAGKREQFLHIANTHGLTSKLMALQGDGSLDNDDSLIDEVARASLLVGAVDNRPSDSFVNFAAGLIASRPSAGEARKRLPRRAILVVRDDTRVPALSESARRAGSTVQVVRENEIDSEIAKYGEVFRRWSHSQED